MNDSDMKLLCIEACTSRLSLALFVGGKPLAKSYPQKDARHHCEALIPAVDELLKDAGVSVKDLSAIAVTRGPGSFTSVRIALATALGLARVDNLPTYALSTLEVLAAGVMDKGLPVLALLDARKGEVYGGMYSFKDNHPEKLLEERVDKVETVLQDALECCSGQKIIVLGEGALAYKDKISSDNFVFVEDSSLNLPDASVLGRLALLKLDLKMKFDPATPNYLRQPEAVVNLGKVPKGLTE